MDNKRTGKQRRRQTSWVVTGFGGGDGGGGGGGFGRGLAGLA